MGNKNCYDFIIFIKHFISFTKLKNIYEKLIKMFSISYILI